ncbi:TMEM175 family protein [uncultured Massilia sp.]|uniref:TMEM175 family protein n=1 Tax=uncultured Massilia sp. TaxID=169973 RepID=UPI0025F7DE9B|nr:TMEM175 family protein [uncultured Massilia sp.]
MGKSRLEAFSDGVIAIAITIMVLELKVPHGAQFRDLLPLWPLFLGYVLSYVYVGIYWVNHHHLLQAVQEVSGGILWANLHLLFWLSLIPFVTNWMGENNFQTWPTVAYGIVLVMSSIAYSILVRSLVFRHPKNAALARALGRDWKGKLSIALYLVGVVASCAHPGIGFLVYAIVAVVWLVPDRRIERGMADDGEAP